MATSSRDRLSVDLRGLKAALLARANSLGVSPSNWVREVVAAALGSADAASATPVVPRQLRHADGRVRLHLRMSREGIRVTLLAAQRAKLSPGDFLDGLVLQIPVLSGGGDLFEHAAALRSSSAELSTLGRNVHRLSALLRQADADSAKAYRNMLDTLAVDVRKHLEAAARVLAELRPRRDAVSDASDGSC